MNLRVLFVNPLAELGGSERSLLDAMSSLANTEPATHVELLLLAEGELVTRARDLGIDVTILPMPKALAQLGESKGAGANRGAWARSATRAALAAPSYVAEFRRHVAHRKPTLLHTNGMKAHLLAAACFRKLPLVAHLRDFPAERPVSRWLLPLLNRPRALVVTNSAAVEADALRVVPRLRTKVVYNGIDLDEFRPGPRELATLAALAGLPAPSDDTLTIGLVATYAWWKGHGLFLSAAERALSRSGRPLRFYIVGGPIYGIDKSELSEKELRAAIREGGLESHVGLVPFQRDVASVYRGLDIVVHASTRAEPFGRTIAEAMATGRPVVVARAGGAVEVFSEGRSGLGYEPGSAEDLARAVLELVEDDERRARLGEAARTEACARFDRRRVGQELVSAYRTLLGEGT